MVQGKEVVNRELISQLHQVLRPFILRRLKRDVAKQLPEKFEHTVYCRLSKRHLAASLFTGAGSCRSRR